MAVLVPKALRDLWEQLESRVFKEKLVQLD
jgi:hypothetical protein